MLKERNPHHVTVHGGPNTPKYLGDVERFFAANPHVDIAVHGEGEATFVDMLLALRGAVGDGPADLSVLGDVAGPVVPRWAIGWCRPPTGSGSPTSIRCPRPS